jgi:hypothetical protein
MQCHVNGVRNIVIDAGQIDRLSHPFNERSDESERSQPVLVMAGASILIGGPHDPRMDTR